jgi:hypothetical protein
MYARANLSLVVGWLVVGPRRGDCRKPTQGDEQPLADRAGRYQPRTLCDGMRRARRGSDEPAVSWPPRCTGSSTLTRR